MNISKIILAFLIICFLIIAFISDIKNYDFITYFLLSLTTITVFIFFLKKKFTYFFLVFFFSSLVSFYLFETYYSLQNYTQEYLAIKQAKKDGVPYDQRTKKEVYDFYKEKRNKENVVVPVSGMDYLKYENSKDNQKLILSGVSKSFNVFCNESGFWTYYNSDRYGFNNPDKVWEKKKNIILIGDSNVHGGCVTVENSIAGKLRSISRSNVINLGMSSNGPLLNYATFKEFGNFKNTTIFWFYSEENDLGDLEIELNYKILHQYLDNENFKIDLKSKINETDRIASEIINSKYGKIHQKNPIFDFKSILKLQNLRKIITIATNNKIELTKIKVPDGYNADTLQSLIKILLKVNDEARLNNSSFVFVYKPAREFYDNRVSILHNESKNNLKYKNYIFSALKKNNIKFIDLDLEMKKYNENILSLYPFKIRSHFNEEGQEIIAKVLFKNLFILN
jgi:hypothetical protein